MSETKWLGEGDRVVVVAETGYEKSYLQKGQHGTVTAVAEGYYVFMDLQVDGEDPWYFGFTEVRKEQR